MSSHRVHDKMQAGVYRSRYRGYRPPYNIVNVVMAVVLNLKLILTITFPNLINQLSLETTEPTQTGRLLAHYLAESAWGEEGA
jgi:hypothetical protein